ncbi:hypothetical protein ISN45_Aa03g028820 [Arabidopsis thaliana x Arabidopsis arenosa]|uniref:Uncharacterized protein n=1 Tax=Arabidopsis thaliana x Arabidopsis arenosa TaxID=1240361 RepID=A0A8T2AYP4_9BRAS|nr:hypothetical protein ISN45_Aa03g028820 [Arabidopsis thaliana x Arabidopsis arenosa]
MASEKPEDPMNNTAGIGTDEESIAQRRKRLRRVSFADREITSVHIFNRDEDYETPPNTSAAKPQNGDTSEPEDKVIRFFGESSDREDTDGDGDSEYEAILDKSFLRPKYSPSSGGSTVGSATSDNEDNFFGPVSSHFINPGRLSDTTFSEEHHEMTMDSTAFSMHFRSLARSESGDVRTPTSSHLRVEEKTPSEVTSRSDTGSAMVLTEPKKLFPKSPVPVDKGSGGRDSNDMSIVGENSRKYDYGYISPTLAAMLGDESKELLPEYNTVEARSPIDDFSSSPQNGYMPIGHGIDSSDACHPQIVLQESGSLRYTKEASLSSSAIRRQSAFLVGMLPQSLSCVTPSPKQGGSFMSRETRALVESLSTIQKSKSRLGLFPPSPGSALSQRIEKSKLQLSGHRSMVTPATGREEIGVLREKHADIPITNLEDLLSKHDNRTPISEKKSIPDKCVSGAFNPAVDTSDDNRTQVSEKKGIPDRCTSGALSPAVDTSVDRTPVLEKKGIPDRCTSGALSPAVDTSDDRTPVSEKKGLSPAVDTSDDRTPVSEKKGMPDQHCCGALIPAVDISDVFARRSPEGNTNSEIEGSLCKQQQRNQTASTPEKFVSSLTNSSNAKPSALKKFATRPDQEQHSKAIETGEGNVTKECASNCSMNTLSDKVDSLLAESSVLLSETGFLNGSAQQKEKDSMLNKNQNRTNISASQSLLKDNNHFKVHCETEVISAEDFPALVTKNLPSTSGSPSMDRYENEASHAKGPSRLKRKAEDVDCAGRSCSPKVGRSTQYISNSVMDIPNGNIDANDCRRVREQVNWVEIPGKVSEKINQMLAPLADKLNSRLICKLEDILTHMKKVHLCEMLCLQIQSQKVCDDLRGAKTKRHAESRSLLCKLAYEKAKLELLHLKKEILMKKFQAVSTGVQTSETLRLNCANFLRQRGFCSTGLLNPVQAQEVIITGKRAEITQEIKELDSKIKNLIQCFTTSDTMTGEPAYADTIMIAEDTLKKRMSCRSIRQDILVWKVDSLGEWNDCQSIVLNYSGVFNQRLTLKPGHPSCVLVSNSLSDTFVKHFPETNVSIPFNSLFNAEDSRKYIGGSNILLEITQKTILRLHNLLDVAEEFHLAQMNIPNLVQGNFDSPSAEQLHLQISFLDCTNLSKLSVILDVTCLIHGKYPSDVVPCELREVSGTKRDGVVSIQLKNEIESAMNDVGVGYPRILRLCRCISKALQSQK